MTSETRVCQNCKQQFVIEPQDFSFYEKMKVPPPTWCPRCRLQRQFSFRNERHLYRRQCNLCHKNIISVFTDNVPFSVYCNNCWWSDNWDPLQYGVMYDFKLPFFEQWRNLFQKVPKLALNNTKSVNSEYTNYATENKNCYLLVSAWENENVLYGTRVHHGKDAMDCYNVFDSSLAYECVDTPKSYGLLYSQECVGCTESSYLFDCRNCTQCIACVGLRSKSFHVFNKQVGKEEFQKIKDKLNVNKEFRESLEKEFEKLKLSIPRKYAQLVKTTASVGDNLYNCKECTSSFDLSECEHCVRMVIGGKLKDNMDVSYDDESQLSYEMMSAHQDYNCRFSSTIWFSRDIAYSQHCMSSEQLFGCNALRHKSYCILNKQYTKKKYEKLIPQIIEQMRSVPYVDKKGRTYAYGEFFPLELSPFAYNETVAQEYFPLTKEEALTLGSSWKEREDRNYQITSQANDLPDHIKAVEDSILKEVIGCEHGGKCNEECTIAFRVTEPELQLYRKLNVPLPKLCPNCRHYGRFKKRNPLKLWHRQCQCAGAKSENGVYANTVSHVHDADHCMNEFETSYASDRPEIVYCEQCYNAEVA